VIVLSLTMKEQRLGKIGPTVHWKRETGGAAHCFSKGGGIHSARLKKKNIRHTKPKHEQTTGQKATPPAGGKGVKTNRFGEEGENRERRQPQASGEKNCVNRQRSRKRDTGRFPNREGVTGLGGGVFASGEGGGGTRSSLWGRKTIGQRFYKKGGDIRGAAQCAKKN